MNLPPIRTLPGAFGALERAKGVLVDWDGCIAFDNQLPEGNADFVRQNAHRVAVVSNNSTDLPGDFAAILKRHDIIIPEERILLAGFETLRALSTSHAYQRIYLIAGERMTRAAEEMGAPLSRESADCVVLMRDPGFTYAKLSEAVRAIENGAHLIVSNDDASHPGRDMRVPETGALLAALQTAADIAEDRIERVGKPSPNLFLRGAEMLGHALNECVMIGDNPHTDGKGAASLDMPFIQVTPTTEMVLSNFVAAEKTPQQRPAQNAAGR